MSDAKDVANCRHSVLWQFATLPDLGDITKNLIFATPNNYAV